MRKVKEKLAVVLTVLAFLSIGPSCVSAQKAGYSAASQQPMIIGLVDLAAVIAFHPAMRNFDYHAKKFVRPWNGRRTVTGKEAWEQNRALIIKIKAIEAKIEKQIQVVNRSLNEFFKKKISKSEKESSVETLKKMNKAKTEMLAELTRKTVGMFPENDFVDADANTGNLIMNEIRRAVYDVSVRNNAAFVLNTSQTAVSGADSTKMLPPAKENAKSLLDRFNIKNLEDLRGLVFETGSNKNAPIGKPPAKMGFRKGGCGEHFDQIKDPAHLQVLMDEYYQNRDVFSTALKNFGSQNFLLQGRSAIVEKNLTPEVVQYILELHKTRNIVRESTFRALK